MSKLRLDFGISCWMSYYFQRMPMYVSMCVVACSYPGDYGEEREGDCSTGCICPLVERQLVSRGPRPLIGQEAETYKVQEGPETCQKPVRVFGNMIRRGVFSQCNTHMRYESISQILATFKGFLFRE